MDEKILTQHPKGQVGVSLTKRKYDIVRGAIIDALQTHHSLTFKELTEDVRRRLYGKLNASIPWYVTTVKLDLEARKIIEQVPKSPKLRLVRH